MLNVICWALVFVSFGVCVMCIIQMYMVIKQSITVDI